MEKIAFDKIMVASMKENNSQKQLMRIEMILEVKNIPLHQRKSCIESHDDMKPG